MCVHVLATLTSPMACLHNTSILIHVLYKSLYLLPITHCVPPSATPQKLGSNKKYAPSPPKSFPSPTSHQFKSSQIPASLRPSFYHSRSSFGLVRSSPTRWPELLGVVAPCSFVISFLFLLDCASSSFFSSIITPPSLPPSPSSFVLNESSTAGSIRSIHVGLGFTAAVCLFACISSCFSTFESSFLGSAWLCHSFSLAPIHLAAGTCLYRWLACHSSTTTLASYRSLGICLDLTTQSTTSGACSPTFHPNYFVIGFQIKSLF